MLRVLYTPRRLAFLLFAALSACGSWTPCSKEIDYCGDTAAYYDSDGDGYDDPIYMGDDCDDNDASAYPGATVVCDPLEYGLELDRDCDGVADELACDYDGDGVTPLTGDCDDLDAAIFPGNEEVCGDPTVQDNDCDGLSDRDDPDCTGEEDTASDPPEDIGDTADTAG